MTELILEILQLAAALEASLTTGQVQEGATVASILFQIATTADQAYQQQTGQALDPSIIKEEDPV